MGLLDLFSNLDPTQSQGLLSAGMGMLNTSGPSLMPHSFGQVMGAGYEGYQAAQQRQQQEAAQKQLEALRALQIKGGQVDLDQHQATLDMMNRIRQRTIDDAQSGQQQADQSATPGGPDIAPQATPAPMLGGPMAPPAAPDWMQAWRAQQPGGSHPGVGSVSPAAAPAPASAAVAQQPAQGNLTQQVLARLTRQAQIHAEEGDMDGANKLYEQATKFMPEVNKIEASIDKQTNQPINVITYKDGRQEVSQFAPKPDIHLADDGQHTAIPIDGFTGRPLGTGLQRYATPDTVLNNQLGARRLSFDQSQAAVRPDLDPKQVENVSDMIASGRMAPLGAMAMRTPFGQAVMSRVAEKNSTYRAQDFGTSSKAEKDFATGKQGNAVRSFNVSLSHLDTLGQLADALNNGDTQVINKLGNSYAQQTGAVAPNNFEAAKKVVTDEVVKAIVGAGGTGHDREEAAKTISSASSPAQLKGVIKTYKDLMVGQLGGLEQQYRITTGRDDFGRYLSPQAQGMLHPTGQQSNGAGATAPAAAPRKSALPGQVVRGYKFKGGDPSVKTNWEQVQ